MPYTGPRRAPLTLSQRKRNARNALGAQLAEGATQAKRVDAPREAHIYQAPAAGLGVVCTAQFIASNVGASHNLAWGAEFGTLTGDGSTTLLNSLFDIQPFSPSQSYAEILEAGWYSMAAYAVVNTTAGDPAVIEAVQGYPVVCVGTGVGVTGHNCVPQACTEPFYVYQADVPFQVLLAVYGTGTAYVSEGSLFITRYDGTPAE